MQLVGLNPTDTQIQNLINEKEYDGEFSKHLHLSACHGVNVYRTKETARINACV